MANVWRQPTTNDSNDFPASHRLIHRPWSDHRYRHRPWLAVICLMYLQAVALYLFVYNPCSLCQVSHKMNTLYNSTFQAPLLLDCYKAPQQINTSHNHNRYIETTKQNETQSFDWFKNLNSIHMDKSERQLNMLFKFQYVRIVAGQCKITCDASFIANGCVQPWIVFFLPHSFQIIDGQRPGFIAILHFHPLHFGRIFSLQ